MFEILMWEGGLSLLFNVLIRAGRTGPADPATAEVTETHNSKFSLFIRYTDNFS